MFWNDVIFDVRVAWCDMVWHCQAGTYVKYVRRSMSPNGLYLQDLTICHEWMNPNVKTLGRVSWALTWNTYPKWEKPWFNSRLCSWFLFNYCDEHTMSWGNIMKLFHIAFFLSKFKPNSNWELMLSPVIRTIMLLSLEFRNTDRRVSISQLFNCSMSSSAYICKKTTVVNSAVQANRICRLFPIIGYMPPPPYIVYVLDAVCLQMAYIYIWLVFYDKHTNIQS